MPRLEIALLSSPHITLDGKPIEVDTRKAVGLIAYLALTQESHSRDALATLLWPEYSQSKARAALRRTLSTLNRALKGEWLEIERDGVALKRDSNLLIDVNQFRHLLAECQTHGHAASEVCARCLKPLGAAVVELVQQVPSLPRDGLAERLL